ncbi:hypothetical protein [Aureispira sp. CCB-E]|uniref:hypothetical protein n=1 Tax=Aureispira sp. CCB-E TaxID=3051121 RepID=UPI002868482F|nr:hypothetical protein [Aureispira sp. CCB-E]WMX16829.1 hypothetical protein QP953_10650 [Aureispira sp. CCB-E]
MQQSNFLNYKITFFLLLSILFFACERIVETLAPIDFEYYPIEVGKYKTYQIDSIVYDEYNCTVQTTTYQIKEVTETETVDGEGDPAFVIKRYFRKTSNDAWVLYNIWTEKIEGDQVQRVEDNQRMIKMVAPMQQDRRWDGIVYIRRDTLVPIRGGSIDMFKDWDDFVCEDIGDSFVDTLSNTIYPDVAKIVQVDKTNNIERRFSTEVYAKGIGMVYKEMRILDTQCRPPGTCTGNSDIGSCIGTPWHIKAEKGFILKQSLIEHNY